MEAFGKTMTKLMRIIASNLQYPVILLLLILAGLAVILLGTIVVEKFTEHRKLKANLPKLVDELRAGNESIGQTIVKGGLLKSQVKILTELTVHPELTPDMRAALATRLVEEESSKFERRVMISDLIAKLGPMFGLLGTLIPLGPGIIALGQKNTYILSQSLMTAFDTTVLGLSSAAVALVISTVRKRWYTGYMSVLNALTECVLEVEDAQTEK